MIDPLSMPNVDFHPSRHDLPGEAPDRRGLKKRPANERSSKETRPGDEDLTGDSGRTLPPAHLGTHIDVEV